MAKKKQYADAEKSFKKALDANCDFADAYFALALIAREHRKDPRAAAHYCRMYLLYDSRSPRAAQAARWIEDAEGGGKGGG